MQKNLSNKELVAAGHKFAANISADTPLIDMAKMVSELATQLHVALAAAAEACKQRDLVVAENVALKGVFGPGEAVLNFLTIALRHTTYDEIDLNDVSLAFEMSLPETPATDAYLNAVRAEGVEMFANHFNCPDISDDILEFAAQLRAGNAGKDGSHE
ncbi:hypothetical protein [Pantoea dispersa]|uniref:hypothetical protein n=1 Tax=Pantoea dispersa TaxID=59814 RepID=UPI003215633E